jgi:hypothetical protein
MLVARGSPFLRVTFPGIPWEDDDDDDDSLALLTSVMHPNPPGGTELNCAIL